MEENILKLRNILNNIDPLDNNSMICAKKRLDSLAKPLGSLGKLESLGIQVAGIKGKVINNMHKKRVIIMCSDNGVVSEGVASCPQRLTREQSINFTKGTTGVGVIANCYNTDLMVVDVGINDDLEVPKIINRKIRKSTSNMAKGPAMTYEEAVKAILIGIEMVKKSKEEGYDILGVGEMGIGNTTTSSATMVGLTGCDVNKAVGKGAGLTDEGFEKKKFIVKHSIIINKPKKDDPIDIVSKVGGFDIAAMAGVFIGSAYYKIPVVIDGFISSVAALIAVRLNPMVKEYLIPSHASKEIGFKIVMEELELEPLLTLDMRLGEGSGCPFAFSIIESSCKILSDMVTFEEAKIDNSYFEDIMEEKNYVV